MPVESIIEIVAGFLFNQAAGHGLRALKKVGKRVKLPRMPRLRGFFVSRTVFINRERELRAIRAILGETPHLRVMYLFGPGGVGKTRLLEETENLAKKVRTNIPLRWAGVLDLYHPDMRSVLYLQDAIVQRLDPELLHFKLYRDRRARFEQRRTEGLSGPGLDKERHALTDIFLQDYNLFAQYYRPVLAFDTLESLVQESDLMQTLCQLEDPVITAWDWLLARANQLANTAILLAGRPQPTVNHSLQEIYGDKPGHLEMISLSGLTREDSRRLLRQFLKEASSLSQRLNQQADRLWQLTQGLPVQLALVTELVAQNEGLDVAGWQETKDVAVWGRRLVQTLFDSENPNTQIFFFLALARRGLTVDLLHFLSGWDEEACQKRLENVNHLSVVKTRPGSDETFLHDALYELFDAYFPAEEDLNYWYQQLVDYYRNQQSLAGSERAVWGKATVSLLYYELQRNPRQAFEASYLRWDDIVIRGREHELDAQLRNEFLRFFNTPLNKQRAAQLGLTATVVEQASAIRWVKRLLYQSNHQQAIVLAEIILSLTSKPHLSMISKPGSGAAHLPSNKKREAQEIFEQADSFFWGQLLTYYGEALAFIGAEEAQAEAVLEQAIHLLKSETFDEAEPLSWLQERMLGQAYRALGYLLRSYGHYSRALAAYGQALRHFRVISVADEQATTLNNIAFLLAQLGDAERAKRYVDEAFSIRQSLGQRYPLGLGYNTRGLIYALQGQFAEAKADCQRALKIFQQVESARGLGLAYNALGFISRQQGEGWKVNRCNPQEAVAFFQQAEEYLEQAAEIFSEQVDEPIRLWEAFNEQGSLYCDWAYLFQREGDTTSAEQKRTVAVQYHLKALGVARQHGLTFQEADTCDDLAQVTADRGDLEQAQDWLNQGLSLVPTQYIISSGQGVEDITQDGDFYRLILGKAHLQQGIWLLRSAASGNLSQQQTQGTEQFVLATLYFQQYWRGSEALAPKLRIMARHLNRTGISFEQVQHYINQLAPQYKADLTVLIEAIKADLVKGPEYL